MPVRVARIEVQVVGVAPVRWVQRGRPVVAIRVGIAEAGVDAVARCWKENGTTVRPCELSTIDAILGCPSIGAMSA